jgi:2-dehydro-3-deoxy-D-arabinonate dehydratase
LDLKRSSGVATLADVLAADNPTALVRELLTDRAVPLAEAELLAPIDAQEVWAAGVTYRRSREARREESVGAGSFYDQVYDAARPELFFKATPHRVVGPGQPIRIRRDTSWTVPEPELTFVLSPRVKLVGYTIGNDMSARDIEGRNPLYLPQAKVYNDCCALGPVVTLADAMPEPEQVEIRLHIEREGRIAFDGATTWSAMKRTPRELVDWLGQDNSFPAGAFLLTGTGVVPPDEFSLAPSDVVSISITGIGTLTNTVYRD